MKDQSFYISKLLIKKHHSFLTKEEEEVLNTWLASNPKNQELANDLLEKANLFSKNSTRKLHFKVFKQRIRVADLGFSPMLLLSYSQLDLVMCFS